MSAGVTQSETLDYFGVVPVCGCLTAWMSGSHSTPREVREFYANMAKTGRDVRRMALTEENRARLAKCPHGKADPS